MINASSKKNNNVKTGKEQRYVPENQQSRISRYEKQKQTCFSCRKKSNLICYGCCFEFACQNCFDMDHYAHCNKQFNHFAINFVDFSLDEQNKSKRNGKSVKSLEKCQRCLESYEKSEYCTRCKVNLCLKCSSEVHSFGKFALHSRRQSINTNVKCFKSDISTVDIEPNEPPFLQKLNNHFSENSEQALKRNERMNKYNPLQNKQNQGKGQSGNKNLAKNAENVSKTALIKEKNHHLVSIEDQISYPVNVCALTNKLTWQVCQQHNKLRGVLTENFDLICEECYDQIKSSVSKLKNIDIISWKESSSSREETKLSLTASLNEFTIKMKELDEEFSQYKSSLLQEFTKSSQILHSRYKYNLLNVSKWESLYKSSIENIIKKCENRLFQNSLLFQSETSSKDLKGELLKIIGFKNLLTLEEITYCKKQYYQLLDQYEFHVHEINPCDFQQLLKNYSFARRKIECENLLTSTYQQKSLSKVSHTHQLKQSRASNLSSKTDKKPRRDESSQKSNYYDIDVNDLFKGSTYKEIKENLEKNTNKKASSGTALVTDRKCNIKKMELSSLANSQYFFDPVPNQRQKVKGKLKKEFFQTVKLCSKEVDLQKIEATVEGNVQIEKTILTPSEMEINLTNYASGMKLVTQLTDPHQSKKHIGSEKRMDISDNPLKMTCNSTANSTHNTSASNKNKKKGEFLQIRDRLRKPNLLHKLTK